MLAVHLSYCNKMLVMSCVFSRMGTRIYIGRLSHHAREKDVEKFFRSYGKIRDIMLKNGYGFVVSMFFKLLLMLLSEL